MRTVVLQLLRPVLYLREEEYLLSTECAMTVLQHGHNIREE